VKILALTTLALAACASETVDQPPIPSSEYTTWGNPIVAFGELPGHGGDTYRIIYANDTARTYEGGQYPEGTILVKEVHDLANVNGVPTAGALQYVAIMRRLGPPPRGLTDEGGWLFSYTSDPGGTETKASYCWDACHVDAPYHGAWLDYSK
jgi:hypothetical protein